MLQLLALPFRWWPVGLFVLALAACHDAPRDNPFDPVLTPAVELELALDDTAGTATLTWTPYEGEQPFAEYRVLRNIAKSTEVDTTFITEQSQTSFVDTSLAPNTAYVYRVSVVNASGFEQSSDEKNIAGYSVTAVTLLEAEVDPQRSAIELTWSRFVGARFNAYWVERRAGDQEDFIAINQMAVTSDTTFTDSGLKVGLSYFYRIVVEAAGQQWPSNPSRRLSFSLSPVVLLDVKANREQGVVELRWRRFAGAQFEVYRVERRGSTEADFTAIAWIEAARDTVFTDARPVESISYFYRVVVEARSDFQQGIIELESDPQGPVSYIPTGRALLEGQLDLQAGAMILRWQRYTGPGFERYEIRRGRAGEEDELLGEVPAVMDTTWVDNTLRPYTFYRYQVKAVAQDQEQSTQELDIAYDLPPVKLRRLVFFYPPGRAELLWTRYEGPQFEAYEVRRKAEVGGEIILETVTEIKDITQNTYTDTSALNFTDYAYSMVALQDSVEWFLG